MGNTTTTEEFQKRIATHDRLESILRNDIKCKLEIMEYNLVSLIESLTFGKSVFIGCDKLYKLPNQEKGMIFDDIQKYFIPDCLAREMSIDFEYLLWRFSTGKWKNFARDFYFATTHSKDLENNPVHKRDFRYAKNYYAILDKGGNLILSFRHALFFFYVQQLILNNFKFAHMQFFHYLNGRNINETSGDISNRRKGMLSRFKKNISAINIPIICHNVRWKLDLGCVNEYAK